MLNPTTLKISPAESHYIEDLESLIKDHKLRLISFAVVCSASKGFEPEIKTDCDIVKDMKKIDADENFESHETLQQQRKELSDKLIFTWQKLKFFRENITECESKKEIAGELPKLYMQCLHISVVHNK